MCFKILAFLKNTKKLICCFKTELSLIPLNLMKSSEMGKCLCQSYKAAFWWTLVSNDFGVKSHIQLELLRRRRPGSNQSWNPSKYSAACARRCCQLGAICSHFELWLVPDRLNWSISLKYFSWDLWLGPRSADRGLQHAGQRHPFILPWSISAS